MGKEPDIPLKCEVCKHMIFREESFGYWCKALNHPLENGYAMRFHSVQCGDLFKLKDNAGATKLLYPPR